MSEQKTDIEIFDSEDEAIIPTLNNEELYDIKGNLITADDVVNTLPDNTDLIQKAMSGNKQAFESLYMQSYRYVFFVVRQYIPDDETTYDAIQETFIKVYKNISNLREPNAFYGWITAIAKNTARDFLRDTHSEASFSKKEDDYSTFLSDDETQKDVTLDIESVLKRLDPQDAELLSLVYYDGMSIAQIAKMQGKPATTVYSRFNKAKKNLKAQLNAHGIDKAIYSGNFVSMVTVAIRNIIGTALLSVAIAQQILDSIISGKGKKELAVATIIRGQQKRAILKIASVIVAISMLTSAVTALTLIDLHKVKSSGDGNYLNSETTKHNYETESSEDNNTTSDSSNGESIADVSGDIDSSNISQDLPHYTDNPSINSDNTSQSNSSNDNDSSKNSSTNSTVSTNPDDDTAPTDEIVNTYGNNPNNVMRTLDYGVNGTVAKSGDWIYYVEQGMKLIKVKTDGSDKQALFESNGYSFINGLNVVGDTVYYINGGICSIKTDGTGQKQISSKSASNLLVRGNTGWFVEASKSVTMSTPPVNVSYNLYQIDLITGKNDLLVENAKGVGLKTVVDDTLIYVDGISVYAKSLSTGASTEIANFDFCAGIKNMVADESSLYFSFYYMTASHDWHIAKLNLNNYDTELTVNKLRYIYNCFGNNGGAFFAQENVSPYTNNFFALNGSPLCEENKNIEYYYGIYTFDDGYAYYFGKDLTALYKSRPDGSNLKIY